MRRLTLPNLKTSLPAVKEYLWIAFGGECPVNLCVS